MHKWWHSLVSRPCFLCENALASHTQPTPSADRPMRATESDPPWGWLGLACETTAKTAPETKGLSLLHTYMHTRLESRVCCIFSPASKPAGSSGTQTMTMLLMLLTRLVRARSCVHGRTCVCTLNGTFLSYLFAALCYRNAKAYDKARDTYERAADTYYKNHAYPILTILIVHHHHC